MPGYFPTGERTFYPGAAGNYEGWSDPRADALMVATATAPAGQARAALDVYQNYLVQQAPVVFVPTPVGDPVPAAVELISRHLGGYSNNVFMLLTPETWRLTS